jgi:hypothetical protein
MSERDWTPGDRADEMRDEEERRRERGMGPRHDRAGMFVYHDCWKCRDGSKPCVSGDPGNCEYPHARDD